MGRGEQTAHTFRRPPPRSPLFIIQLSLRCVVYTEPASYRRRTSAIVPRLAITRFYDTTKSLGGRAKTGARYRVAWRPRSLERLCKPVSPVSPA